MTTVRWSGESARQTRSVVVATVLFTLGWVAGWLMLWRARPLPCARQRETAVSVVIPARNEAASIGALLASLRPQLRDGDQLIVIDDHSADATAAIAAASGATVVAAPELPGGWAGKPHACSIGANRAVNPVLVFIDADVTVAAGTLDGLVATVERRPDLLVSIQPWHRTLRCYEQLSLLFNLTALMGAAAFTVFGARVATRVAFGPVIACHRDAYRAAGGHDHPAVRGAVLEDIALGRLFPRTLLHAGTATGTSFRMYPGGPTQLIEGWTKGFGIGVDATPWWALVATAAWVTSLAGGWLTSPWFALASLVQLFVLAGRAGRFSWWAVALFPLAVVFFAFIVVRSLWRRRMRRGVSWKGRVLTPDQGTG